MPPAIAINGFRLDKLRLSLTPYSDGTVAFLSYPLSQIHCARVDGGLCLTVPANLAVELYQRCILPQDAGLPVEVRISGRSAGWYTVTEVRYPHQYHSAVGKVIFTLTRVLHETACDAAGTPRRRRSAAVEGAYVLDITHYLDARGDVAALPAPARKLASFLTLLIEAATGVPSAEARDARIRCRTNACTGSIWTSLPSNQDAISWHCPACGLHGVIRNWQATKWNQRQGSEQRE